jgi:hypothetical protein
MIFKRAFFLFLVIGSLFADENREKQLETLDLPSIPKQLEKRGSVSVFGTTMESMSL